MDRLFHAFDPTKLCSRECGPGPVRRFDYDGIFLGAFSAGNDVSSVAVVGSEVGFGTDIGSLAPQLREELVPEVAAVQLCVHNSTAGASIVHGERVFRSSF